MLPFLSGTAPTAVGKSAGRLNEPGIAFDGCAGFAAAAASAELCAVTAAVEAAVDFAASKFPCSPSTFLYVAPGVPFFAPSIDRGMIGPRPTAVFGSHPPILKSSPYSFHR